MPPLHAIIGLAATRCCVACAAIGLAISAEAPPTRDRRAKSCISIEVCEASGGEEKNTNVGGFLPPPLLAPGCNVLRDRRATSRIADIEEGGTFPEGR